MPTRDDIVRVARSYIGTPFHHQGRLKGVGVDCVGLVVGVGSELGICGHDYKTYSRQPDGETLVRELSIGLNSVEIGRPGSVVVFWLANPSMPTHAGILTNHGMVHTYGTLGKVVEHRLTPAWRKRITCYFDYEGIE